jgi:hypothetical protein
LFESNAFIQINTLIQNYTDPVNQNLQFQIDIDTFNDVKLQLYNFKKITDSTCCFYNIIDIYMNIWNLLNLLFKAKNDFFSLQESSQQWQNDSHILHNTDLLNEYINEMNNKIFFTNINVLCVDAIIKPRYKLYHELYGFPENFNYDPELLQKIDNSLQK